MNDAKKSVNSRVALAVAPDRRQERARTTRHALIDAARQIFARDGFEQARLEDIAMAAGKTRGAFYANFADKEDVFFAIFEEDLARDQAVIREQLLDLPSHEDRLQALAQVLLTFLRDKRRMLLVLEFKLYAMRRPNRHKRLAALHAAMCLRCAETHIDYLLPEHSDMHARQKRQQTAVVAAVLDGLTLNRLFDPDALSEAHMLLLLRAAVAIAAEQAS